MPCKIFNIKGDIYIYFLGDIYIFFLTPTKSANYGIRSRERESERKRTR